MKHRIRIKRRDGVRQRYWVGRRIRKSYGNYQFVNKEAIRNMVNNSMNELKKIRENRQQLIESDVDRFKQSISKLGGEVSPAEEERARENADRILVEKESDILRKIKDLQRNL